MKTLQIHSVLKHSVVKLVAFSCVAFIVGCGGGSDEVKRIEVTGVVSWAGAPVDGEIRFVSDNATDAGTITNGSYSVMATPGPKTVEIYASKETGEKIESAVNEGEMESVMEMYIPAKYNTESELKADVTSSGDNSFNFDLTK